MQRAFFAVCKGNAKGRWRSGSVTFKKGTTRWAPAVDPRRGLLGES